MAFRPRRLLAIALLLGIGTAAFIAQSRSRQQPQFLYQLTSRFRKAPVLSIDPALLAQAPVLDPSRFTPSPSDPNILRDYDPLTPIPDTGTVTVRGSMDEAPSYLTFEDCPAESGLYAVAESTSYVIQVCSAETDPWLPKYFTAQAKDGSGAIQVTNEEEASARQLIFKGDRYWYILYRDGARPEIMNAYLEIYTPEGRIYAEALWFMYERRDYPNAPNARE